jgi:signal transduction histidine kinase
VPNQRIRILVVEDSEPDYDLLLLTLRRQGLDVECERVEDEPQMRQALSSREWDAVISDHNLPRFSSSAALQTLQSFDLVIPFIIVSGEIGEEAAVEAMRNGADDYVIKGRWARLVPALRRALDAAELRREKQAAERALHESEEQLHDLASHLQTNIDMERTAIAREIHDDVGGSLTALKFDLAWLERNSGDTATIERVKAAIETLNHAMTSSQRIMRNLRPAVLDQGIIPALEWHVTQFGRRTGLATRFTSNTDDLVVDSSIAMTLYRVCQESLTNIAKHAEASEVKVDLFYGAETLSLEISDNGKGFSSDDLKKPTSFGLRGLQERARKVDGWIELSAANGRTTVMLTIPFGSNNAFSDAPAGNSPQ